MPIPRPPLSGRTSPSDDRELRDRPVQPRGAKSEQSLTRGGGGAAHARAPAREPGAAAGSALVRAQARVPVDDRDAPGRHAEFFGGHLRDRDPHARSDVDLAGVDRDGAVGVDGEEAVHFAEIERLPALAGRRRGLGRARQRNRAEREAHHEGAAGLEQIASRDRRRGLRAPFAIASARQGGARRRLHRAPDARITARRMRVCAPQRQRCPASACFA